MVRITALMDDRGGEHLALTAEHGLSFFVEADGKRFLFDTGASQKTLENASRLGIDLQGLDGVILSHSHYDHAGGYRDLIDGGLGSDVLYTGPYFFEPKFAKDKVRYSDLSAGFDEAYVKARRIRHCEVRDALEIAPGVWVLCGFERPYSFETIPERFVRQTPDGFVQDLFPDEVCLAIRHESALIVLVGCSHPGILNIMTHVQKRLGMPIKAVFGGTHLMEADEARIHKTLEVLKSLGTKTIGFSHCSGEMALSRIQEDPEMEGCHLCTGDRVFYA
ncbi:MAG: MBL fold metallo-hydrolase [Firmicutes bacterium]|nr:MBL fold metallo-hydrolase [Bacillota bacterium]